MIPVCPETLGGLPTPRQPAEILGGDGAAVLRGSAKVISIGNDDVSKAFITGAERVASLIQKQVIVAALLKRFSPSCGNDQIYDGSFSNRLVAGSGVTAHMLAKHGIPVFNEDQLNALARLIEENDSACGKNQIT